MFVAIKQDLPQPWDVVLSAAERSGALVVAAGSSSVLGPLCGPPLDMTGPTAVCQLVSKMAAVDRILVNSQGCGLSLSVWSAEERRAVFSLLVNHPPSPG